MLYEVILWFRIELFWPDSLANFHRLVVFGPAEHTKMRKLIINRMLRQQGKH